MKLLSFPVYLTGINSQGIDHADPLPIPRTYLILVLHLWWITIRPSIHIEIGPLVVLIMN